MINWASLIFHSVTLLHEPSKCSSMTVYQENMFAHTFRIEIMFAGSKHMPSANGRISVTIKENVTESVSKQKHL